ncbi:hypothetical protein J6590_045194 [Homalodisca vitripennis]|nr:hypothetical protein J6590_045194 [Homalodisca vitripennis]
MCESQYSVCVQPWCSQCGKMQPVYSSSSVVSIGPLSPAAPRRPPAPLHPPTQPYNHITRHSLIHNPCWTVLLEHGEYPLQIGLYVVTGPASRYDADVTDWATARIRSSSDSRPQVQCVSPDLHCHVCTHITEYVESTVGVETSWSNRKVMDDGAGNRTLLRRSAPLVRTPACTRAFPRAIFIKMLCMIDGRQLRSQWPSRGVNSNTVCGIVLARCIPGNSPPAARRVACAVDPVPYTERELRGLYSPPQKNFLS